MQRDTIHVKDIPDAEKDLLWITAVEFMEAKKQYTEIVRMMMRSRQTLQETEDICCRGLEFRTKEGARRRKRVKKKAAEAVLVEQEIQRDEGIFDDTWLSEVYRDISGPSALEALNRGLKDQKSMLDLLDPQVRSEREQRTGSKKPIDVLSIPPRRRSITETLTGSEIPTAVRLVTDLK